VHLDIASAAWLDDAKPFQAKGSGGNAHGQHLQFVVG
jgi:hypothetical protein